MKRIFGIMAVTCLTSLSTLAQTAEGFILSKMGAKAEYTVTHGEMKKLAMGYAYVYQTKENTKVEVREDGTTRVITKNFILNKKKKPSNFAGIKEGYYTAIDVNPDGSYTISDLLFGPINTSASNTGFLLKIPAELKVGDALECGTTTTTSKTLGITFTNSTTYSDFQVVEERDHTTSAGTFHCYVVKGKNTTTFNKKTFSYDEEYWFAKGVGIVLYKIDVPQSKEKLYFELTSLSM